MTQATQGNILHAVGDFIHWKVGSYLCIIMNVSCPDGTNLSTVIMLINRSC